MGTRKLKITTITPGVEPSTNEGTLGSLFDKDKMDEVHIYFSRPLTPLEFSGVTAAIEKAIR